MDVLHWQSKMDSCIGVEREIDKVLGKFAGIKGHTESTLQELIESVRSVKEELEHGKEMTQVSY